MSDAGAVIVHACGTEALPPHWPRLQVLAIFHRPAPAATPGQARAAAQQLAREVLRENAGADLAARGLDLPRPRRGGQAVSVSHEAAVSLLAWSEQAAGAVGVDVVALDSLAHASPQALVDTAGLYLGPDAAREVAAAPQPDDARLCFARHWASLEARLKCLGLELDEWRPARARSLDGVGCVQVGAIGPGGQPCRRWTACVAWRPG